MDPDEALAIIRGMVTDHYHDQDVDLDTFVVTIDGLDEWLSKGGFLPESWQAATPHTKEGKQ